MPNNYLPYKKKLAITFIYLCTLAGAACQKQDIAEPAAYRTQINTALSALSLNAQNISLPKVPYPVSKDARLNMVDAVLADPASLITNGEAIKHLELKESRSEYLKDILNILDIGLVKNNTIELPKNATEHPNSLLSIPSLIESTSLSDIQAKAIQDIFASIQNIQKRWSQQIGKPTSEEVKIITSQLMRSAKYYGNDLNFHIPENDETHQVGKRIELSTVSSSLLSLFSIIEQSISILSQNTSEIITQDFETQSGLIRIAGAENNTHEGDFLLLIDLGGNDTYINQGSDQAINQFSIIIDLSGNDVVSWQDSTGPATGILGLSIWFDMEGNDTYKGGNYGTGSAILGGGLFWDESGDDIYKGGIRTQGAAQYGTGIFVDGGGDDTYSADMLSQGFAGPGGVGIQIDYSGNDSYQCGGKFPDQHKKRQQRHLSTHYLSMCQGFSFGIRPKVSGGIGILIDSTGNDSYTADIFGQGSSYWFGLGMLIDGNGNDNYNAFEHAQGESLHLSAGFLGDWAGNDTYAGYEHVQGVGVDRSAGILYDKMGNDSYSANNESQGAGIKPFGLGILLDQDGNDIYKAIRESQGYAKPDMKQSDEQWPIGIFYDQSGMDKLEQPYIEPIGEHGRIQNKQGISFDL